MDQHDTAGLDKLKVRIQALRAKTIDNGCTEDEALSAAAKVAELLDRYDLSLTDVELRAADPGLPAKIFCVRTIYNSVTDLYGMAVPTAACDFPSVTDPVGWCWRPLHGEPAAGGVA